MAKGPTIFGGIWHRGKKYSLGPVAQIYRGLSNTPVAQGQQSRSPSDAHWLIVEWDHSGMAKSDFRKFVPEMGKAFHFGKTQKQFYDAVIAVRGDRE